MDQFLQSLEKNEIAIVVPTRNEEETIEAIGKSLETLAPPALLRKNIFIIDGHSTDGTREIAEKNGWQVILQKGKGKGLALRESFETIERDIIVFIDADGSHDCRDIPRLVQPVLDDKADMVVASRILGGSDEFHGSLNNFVRMIGSGLLTLAINYRWQVGLTDIENGFRAIRRNVALRLGLSSEGFTIEQEMVMKAVKKKFRVIEIASHEFERQGGVSKLPTSQGWKFIGKFLIDII